MPMPAQSQIQSHSHSQGQVQAQPQVSSRPAQQATSRPPVSRTSSSETLHPAVPTPPGTGTPFIDNTDEHAKLAAEFRTWSLSKRRRTPTESASVAENVNWCKVNWGSGAGESENAVGVGSKGEKVV